MAVPNIVFIDTCIFDGVAYNFDSEKMKAFLNAAEKAKLTLLLPITTQHEVLRHLDEKQEEVIKALEDVRHKVPFITKWKDWPTKKENDIKNELRVITSKEWNNFLARLTVIKIDYSDLKIEQVMSWYSEKLPPFENGRKEFPDAISIALVLEHARKNDCNIAIISTDGGVQEACQRFPELLRFPNLPAYTEALLASDSRVDLVRATISKDTSLLKQAITNEFPYRGFYLRVNPLGHVDDVKANTVTITDIKIIAVGDKQATIAFEALVKYSANIEYLDVDIAEVYRSEHLYMADREKVGTVTDEVDISGSAKLTFSNNWNVATQIELLQIDQIDIGINLML